MKMFKCPNCGEKSTAWSWNRCTNKKLTSSTNKKRYKHKNIIFVSIKDDKRPICWYTCPSCGINIDGAKVEITNIE